MCEDLAVRERVLHFHPPQLHHHGHSVASGGRGRIGPRSRHLPLRVRSRVHGILLGGGVVALVRLRMANLSADLLRGSFEPHRRLVGDLHWSAHHMDHPFNRLRNRHRRQQRRSPHLQRSPRSPLGEVGSSLPGGAGVPRGLAAHPGTRGLVPHLVLDLHRDPLRYLRLRHSRHRHHRRAFAEHSCRLDELCGQAANRGNLGHPRRPR
mmetsp:Transcript_104450/g.334857  ORF Transcript_104450/g.334857 Transcript_104450/m.334857 type:complete len:208 (+) Transcript_104450:533-1156(+)